MVSQMRNGKAVIDNEAAEQIKTLFNSPLASDSYIGQCAKKAGIKSFHAGIGRILRNTCYLGDDHYPAIIDQETFVAAEAERIKRVEKLGRTVNKKKN